MVPSLVVQVHLQLSHDLLLLNMHQLCVYGPQMESFELRDGPPNHFKRV